MLPLRRRYPWRNSDRGDAYSAAKGDGILFADESRCPDLVGGYLHSLRCELWAAVAAGLVLMLAAAVELRNGEDDEEEEDGSWLGRATGAAVGRIKAKIGGTSIRDRLENDSKC